MNWSTCIFFIAFIASTSVVASEQESEVEHRERRQSNIGAPQQFGIARPPQQQLPAQLVTRGSPQGPPLTFQLVQGYRPDDRSGPAPTQLPSQQLIRPTPQPQLARTRAPQHIIPTAGPRVQQQQAARRPQQQRGRLQTNQELADELAEEAAEELEEDKPDRLTQLLPLSKFDCAGRGTGYYADEELECEVFHYCQAGAKHSWICPEGFTFHQVHLICMPPGGDNICKKSSQFHFVNEYLYRPINAEEAQTKPNVTLRYADRYYPETYDHREDEGAPAFLPQPQRQRLPAPPPQRTSTRPAQPQVSHIRPNNQAPLLRAVPQHQFQQRPTPGNQVFHSPEEVNIPLQHRRPIPVAAQQRSQQQNYGNDEEEEYDYEEQPYRQG